MRGAALLLPVGRAAAVARRAPASARLVPISASPLWRPLASSALLRQASARGPSEDSYEFPEDAPPRLARTSKDVASGLVAEVIADRSSRAEASQTRTLAVLVENSPGVLAKIVGLLSARGFNISSLTVSQTNIPDLSRITVILADAPDAKALQAVKVLNDVVSVWATVDFQGTDSLQRELVMVKVAMTRDALAAGRRPSYEVLLASQSHRAAVRDIGDLFGAEVVDVGSSHVVFQLTSWSRRIDAFIRMLEPFGVIEVARSGVVAMIRLPVAGGPTERLHTPTAAPDASELPPG